MFAFFINFFFSKKRTHCRLNDFYDAAEKLFLIIAIPCVCMFLIIYISLVKNNIYIYIDTWKLNLTHCNDTGNAIYINEEYCKIVNRPFFQMNYNAVWCLKNDYSSTKTLLFHRARFRSFGSSSHCKSKRQVISWKNNQAKINDTAMSMAMPLAL